MGECSVSAAGDGMQEGRWWWWWWWESLRAPVGPAQPSVTSQQVRGAVSLDTGTGAARPGRDHLLQPRSLPCTPVDSGGRLYFSSSTMHFYLGRSASIL